MGVFSKRTTAAGLPILVNSLLTLGKVTVAVITGSISILAEGIHSAVDLLATLMAFFSIRAASKPADSTHNFGHGKIENLSGTIEGTLIFIAAGIIVYESVQKLIGGAHVEQLDIGVGIMAVSAITNYLISRRQRRLARKFESVALEADAWHLVTDSYTSFGVMVGLVAVWITGWHVLDPIIAMAVAALVIRAAWGITRKAFRPLLDARLPKHELKAINACITAHTGEIVGFHDLRTRKSGYQRFIDMHIVFPKSVTVEEAHRTCDLIEQDINRRLPNSHVIIHCEPCELNTDGSCPTKCSAKKTCPTSTKTLQDGGL